MMEEPQVGVSAHRAKHVAHLHTETSSDQEPARGARQAPPFLVSSNRLGPFRIWLLYAILAAFVVFGNLSGPDDFKMTQWWLSYDLGFVKRGLMGTLLKPLSAQLGHELAANLASMAILTIAMVAIAFAATVFTVRQRGSSTSWLVSAAFITMPGSVASLAHDFGRYDGLLVAIVLWSAWATWRIVSRPRPSLLLSTGLVAVQLLGILIHEIHLFVAGPAILAVALINWRDAHPIARGLVVTTLAITTLATGIVGVLGRVSGLGADALRAMAAADLPFDPKDDAILVLTRTLSENVSMTMDRWSSPVGIAALGSTAFGLIPVAILMALLLRRMHWLHRVSIMGAALGPLALSVLGFDIGRWATFASLNGVLLTMVAMDADREAGAESTLGGWQAAVLAYAVLLGATIGGMGITVGVPSVANMMTMVLSALMSPL